MSMVLYERRECMERVAVIEDNRLAELIAQPLGEASLVGNLYLGRVANVLPGMHSAFVEIGLYRTAFLSLDDLSIPDATGAEFVKKPQLKGGHELIVQIAKLPGGDKGAKLTACPTLPGKQLVLLPLIDFIGISRKIADDAEKARLRAIAKAICPKGMGLILRTAAEGASEDALREDADQLVALWQAIEQKARYAKAPALLHQAPTLLDMALREFPEVVVEDAALLREGVKLHASDTGLFALHRVDAQAEKMKNRYVYLPSGGTIVIDRTEAMTVIDVNSAKSVGKGSLEQTAFETNIEAAIEAARQIRLRDIGGIVIIDFIDLHEESHKRQLTDTLAAELQKDRAKTRLYGLTKLHLMELTRKALNPPPAKPPRRDIKENT